MIAAVSETYGPTSRLASRPIGTQISGYGLFETPIAIWGDAEYSVTLYAARSLMRTGSW